jgi:MtN3 and saliva related transmembrane protein
MMEILGTVAAFLTTVSFVPQAIKTIRTRDVSGISLLMYLMLFAGGILWAIYGLHHELYPVWIANVVMTFFVSIILVIKVQEMRKRS